MVINEGWFSGDSLGGDHITQRVWLVQLEFLMLLFVSCKSGTVCHSADPLLAFGGVCPPLVWHGMVVQLVVISEGWLVGDCLGGFTQRAMLVELEFFMFLVECGKGWFGLS